MTGRQSCHGAATGYLPIVVLLLTGVVTSGSRADPSAESEAEDEPALADFTTDGCSSFPDGTLEEPSLWRACCVVHDVAYWKGGSKDERHAADVELKNCVAERGKPAVAALMLSGVRVGGSPWLPSGFRWGYGWPFPRGYDEITVNEQPLVERKLAAAEGLLIEEGVNPRAGPDRQAGDLSIKR